MSDEEIKFHQGLIQAFIEANQKGMGATTYEGSMIDQAMYERSISILKAQGKYE